MSCRSKATRLPPSLHVKGPCQWPYGFGSGQRKHRPHTSVSRWWWWLGGQLGQTWGSSGFLRGRVKFVDELHGDAAVGKVMSTRLCWLLGGGGQKPFAPMVVVSSCDFISSFFSIYLHRRKNWKSVIHPHSRGPTSKQRGTIQSDTWAGGGARRPPSRFSDSAHRK